MVCKGHLISGAGFLWHYTSLTTLTTHPKLEYQLRILRKKKKKEKNPKILKTKLNNQKTKDKTNKKLKSKKH